MESVFSVHFFHCWFFIDGSNGPTFLSSDDQSERLLEPSDLLLHSAQMGWVS